MEIKVFKSYQELSRACAKVIIDQVRTNPQSVLGLATGSSPLGLYQELIRDHDFNKTSYRDVMTFNLDEYVGLDKEHPQSFYSFMMENLFYHIDISYCNIHIPNGCAFDIEQECKNYNKLLEENPIDLQVLGIGVNGHIGFNEPGTPFDSTVHIVKLNDTTRKHNARFFNSLQEVPEYAITMGIKNILNAKKIILIAHGKEKSEAIYHLVKGNPTPDWPATALQYHHDVVLFLDEEAASLL